MGQTTPPAPAPTAAQLFPPFHSGGGLLHGRAKETPGHSLGPTCSAFSAGRHPFVPGAIILVAPALAISIWLTLPIPRFCRHLLFPSHRENTLRAPLFRPV